VVTYSDRFTAILQELRERIGVVRRG
jgi:hypothetical protein